MRQWLKGVALSMCCFLAACNNKPEIHFKPIAIPPERIDCAPLIKRPPLTAEYKIDWETVSKAPTVKVAVQLAMLEVQKLMFTIREREKVISNYILNIEGILFGCSSDAEWMRDYTAKTAE
jgi:hypothetical protein